MSPCTGFMFRETEDIMVEPFTQEPGCDGGRTGSYYYLMNVEFQFYQKEKDLEMHRTTY